MENQKTLKMDNKINVNVLKHTVIILFINLILIINDNKINVNVLKHNSYNSDH